MEENLGLLDQYFEPESVVQKREDGDFSAQALPTEKLHAKSVTIAYPHQTAHGIELVDVAVPLITLVPVNSTQLEKVKMKADFQLTMVNDELQLLFPKEKPPVKKGFFGVGKRQRGTFGEIEITITPCDSPSGLNDLIEGYEKALKAQIPH